MDIFSFVGGIVVGYLIASPSKRTQLVKAIVATAEKAEEKQTAAKPKAETKGAK